MFPITSSLSLSTHSDILGILQREQDRAVALLSSSPLLSSLFVSYANQAAATQSATPSTEAEEWKALEHTISTLQEDIDKLKPENLKMTKNLEVATASLDAFRSQVASLKEVISQQQRDLDSLRADQSESKVKCNRLVKDLNAERDNFQSTMTDFAVWSASC
jgi:chromosome segregation ATPase